MSLGLRSMAHPQFSIGIDLGTTNCAMAFEKLDAATVQREVFLISLALAALAAFVSWHAVERRCRWRFTMPTRRRD